MTKDAAFGFPTFASHAVLAQRTALSSAAATNGAPTGGVGVVQNPNGGGTLNLGPLSINLAGEAGGALEAGVESAKDGLRDLFGRARKGIQDGVRLV